MLCCFLLLLLLFCGCSPRVPPWLSLFLLYVTKISRKNAKPLGAHHFRAAINEHVKSAVVVPQVVVDAVCVVALGLGSWAALMPRVPVGGVGCFITTACWVSSGKGGLKILPTSSKGSTKRVHKKGLRRDHRHHHITSTFIFQKSPQIQRPGNTLYALAALLQDKHTPLASFLCACGMPAAVWSSTGDCPRPSTHTPQHPKMQSSCPCSSHPATCNPCSEEGE